MSRLNLLLSRAVVVGLLVVAWSLPCLAESDDRGVTEVVLVGTLHSFHDQCPQFSRSVLRDIVIEVEPSAVLFEMPQEMDGQPTSIDGRIDARFRDPESTAVNEVVDSLSVPAYPYDRDRRNEIYQETRHFEREEYAFGQLMEWAAAARNDKAAVAGSVAMGCLFESVQMAQVDIVLNSGPEVVNSSVFDHLSQNKRCLMYDLLPALLTSADLDTVIADLEFLADEWDTRNEIMADNIESHARKYVGKRIAVLCGAEHRADLRRLLNGREGISVLEYYEAD